MIKRGDINGPKQYTCGEWQVSDVIAGVEHCRVKECRPQPTLKNGQLLGNKNEVGSKKAVVCNHGYIEIDNFKSVVCLKEGIWSHNASCVLQDCGEVPQIENGSVSPDILDKATFGSTATGSCVNGYETNTSSISCSATGSWPDPICSPKDCGGVPPIENGMITLDTNGQTTYHSTASVKSSVGYETENTKITCLLTGQWSTFECVFKCPQSNGEIHLEVNFRLKIYAEEKKQSEAVATCGNEPHGHLVVLDEEWKMSAVSNILASCPGLNHHNNFWTDGTCLNRHCHFTDEMNMPMSQTTFWQAHKPNDNGSNCVRVKNRHGVYRWNDKGCDQKFPFICEY